MSCKVPIPHSNFLAATMTVLACTFSSVAIPSYFLVSDAIAQTWLLAQAGRSSYGLGLPKTASTGGGTRLVNRELLESSDDVSPSRPIIRSRPIYRKAPSSQRQELPLLTLITPEDGARTANSQPTFYWYLFNAGNEDNEDDFVGRLSVVTSEGTESVTILQTDLKMQSGLSSFKLPIAVSLKSSQSYRWQITLQDDQQVTASGWIVYTPPEDALQKSLKRALTIRDRAKIYAEAGYWFDAIDGYTRWLNFKPEDLKARTARNEILKTGFASNQSFNFDAFISLLNASVPK